MAAGFLAFCIVCGLCYGIYLLGRDYERKDEEEKDPDDADGREAETNKEFTEVDNKNKSTNWKWKTNKEKVLSMMKSYK